MANNNINSNQFSKFVYTSPLSSIPHDPATTLASNCIRDYFGPHVQLVADGLIGRGVGIFSTLAQIVSFIESRLHPNKIQRSKERKEIMRSASLRPSNINNELAEMEWSSSSTSTSHAASIRASILVLIQHSIVNVKKTTRITKANINGSSSNNTKTRSVSFPTVMYTYSIDLNRALILPRYPRFVEFSKNSLGNDETVPVVIEELLVQGRASTTRIITATVEQIQQRRLQNQLQHQKDDGGDNNNNTPSNNETTKQTTAAGAEDSATLRKKDKIAVLDVLLRLSRGGYIVRVPELKDSSLQDEEFEFDGEELKGEGPPNKKPKINDRDTITDGRDETTTDEEDENGEILALIQNHSTYKSFLSPDAIWRVNYAMFHEQLRACRLGKLVSERYGQRIQCAGSIVAAALKAEAGRRHGPIPVRNNNNNNSRATTTTTAASMDYESIRNFTVGDILIQLPKSVIQHFEKKDGGVVPNIYKALVELSHLRNPIVVEEVEVAQGQPGQSKFQIQTRKLVDYLRDRIAHQIILDSHGDKAARVCSILRTHGYMESDAIAELAMVPSKETREVLHRLYRDSYVDLFNINQGKQHNPSSMIYLWGVLTPQCTRKIVDSVCTALCNMRLRRQHEVEVGKEWIERERERGGSDENENEADKMMFLKFSKGLERLDNACILLDETLMALVDY